MRLVIHFIINIVAVAVAAALLEGIMIQGAVSAVLAAAVLGIINTVVRPILNILAAPINLLTFGLFSIVLNGLIVLFVARLVPGFTVVSIWWAIAFSLVLAIVGFFLHLFEG